MINAFDPREIIIIGFGPEISLENLKATLNIDVKERLDNPLDEVIEPEIGRSFGVLVSEDDFSPKGELEYEDPFVGGEKTEISKVEGLLSLVRKEIELASSKRDHAKKL